MKPLILNLAARIKKWLFKNGYCTFCGDWISPITLFTYEFEELIVLTSKGFCRKCTSEVTHEIIGIVRRRLLQDNHRKGGEADLQKRLQGEGPAAKEQSHFN